MPAFRNCATTYGTSSSIMSILDTGSRSSREYKRSQSGSSSATLWAPVSPVSDAGASSHTISPRYRRPSQKRIATQTPSPPPDKAHNGLLTPLASPTTPTAFSASPTLPESSSPHYSLLFHQESNRGPEERIKRPPNAFICFRTHAQKTGLVGGHRQNVMSRDAGAIWKAMDADARAPFELQAKEAKRGHMLKYPGYRYTPKKIDGSSVYSENTSRRAMVAVKNVIDCAKPLARSAPRKVNLRLPTPDPSDVEDEYDEPVVEEGNNKTEEYEDNEYTENSGDEYHDLFPGIYIPKSRSEGPHGARTRIPDFAHSPEQPYIINQARVPCLASSTFFKPTYVGAIRAVAISNGTETSSTPSPTDSYHAQNMRHPALSYAHVNRALRPVAPIREAQTTTDFWEDELACLSAASTDVGRASSIMHTDTWPSSTDKMMALSNSWPMIDADAERRAMGIFLADTA